MKIESIWQYPIKGFSGQRLAAVTLRPGAGIPGDRRYALRHAASAFDPAAPRWQKKREFVVLAHTPAPATVATHLDPATGVLRISKAGRELFVGSVATAAGRHGAGFVLGRIVQDARGPVTLVDGGEIALADIATPALSIINRASVEAVAARLGVAVDPLRFRGNVVIDGAAPWAEFDLVGRDITLGTATLRVMKRIDRCVATSVNPATGVVDIQVPAALQKNFGHLDCGIYAEVIGPGEARVGDALTPQ